MEFFVKRNVRKELILWSCNHEPEHDILTTFSGTILKIGVIVNQKWYQTENITLKQLKSIIKKKQRQGYNEINKELIDTYKGVFIGNYDELDNKIPKYLFDLDNQFKPMLAYPYNFTNVDNWLIQPKLNGIRGTMRWEKCIEGEGLFAKEIDKLVIRSREGLVYHLPHITENTTVIEYCSKDKSLNYDGELYIHGKRLNYIKSCIPIINSNGVTSQPKYNPSEIKFYLFDLPIEEFKQQDRLTLLYKIFQVYWNFNIKFDLESYIQYGYNINNSSLVILYTFKVDNIEKAEYCRDCFIMNGFEGAMLKNPHVEYKFGYRGFDMMKLKVYQEGEFKIIDVIPKLKETETAMFILQNDINDEYFKCNPMGEYNERKEYLDNKEKYIGLKATVKFYERSGVKEVPFHANLVTIRDYE